MLGNESLSCEKPTESSAIFTPRSFDLQNCPVHFFRLSLLTRIKRLFEEPSLAVIFFFFGLNGLYFSSKGILCENQSQKSCELRQRLYSEKVLCFVNPFLNRYSRTRYLRQFTFQTFQQLKVRVTKTSLLKLNKKYCQACVVIIPNL